MDPNTFLNNTLKAWAVEFVAARIQDAKAKGLDKTRGLINSFGYELIKATAAGVASVLVAFEDRGRYQDMKRLRYRQASWGREGIKDLEAWIDKVGVNKFKTGFLRKRGKLPTTEAKLINEIAWGIMLGKKKHKRRRWYAKNREKEIGILYDRLLEGWQDITAQGIIKELKK